MMVVAPRCPACGSLIADGPSDPHGVRVYTQALNIALARDTSPRHREAARTVMRRVSAHWGMDSHRERRERPLFGDLIRMALQHRIEGS